MAINLVGIPKYGMPELARGQCLCQVFGTSVVSSELNSVQVRASGRHVGHGVLRVAAKSRRKMGHTICGSPGVLVRVAAGDCSGRFKERHKA